MNDEQVKEVTGEQVAQASVEAQQIVEETRKACDEVHGEGCDCGQEQLPFIQLTMEQKMDMLMYQNQQLSSVVQQLDRAFGQLFNQVFNLDGRNETLTSLLIGQRVINPLELTQRFRAVMQQKVSEMNAKAEEERKKAAQQNGVENEQVNGETQGVGPAPQGQESAGNQEPPQG